jgi:hypothetical protein
MEALSGIVNSIGGFMGGTGGKAIGGIGMVDQFINNWLAQRKQNDYINQQLKYQKNPKLATNEITGMTQPLDQNLTAAVSNQVQGNLGAQGLAESPNIMATVLAQALAPYNQQNQQYAQQLWQSIHGQPPPFPQPANMTPLWSMLMRGSGGGSGGGGSDFSGPGDFMNVLFPGGGGGGSDASTGAGDLFNWGLSDGQAAA